MDDLLHKFLMEGGLVTHSKKRGSYISLPDHWWDLYEDEARRQLQDRILHLALSEQNMPHLTLQGAAEKLGVNYWDVQKLIRFQKLGSLKIGRQVKVYAPSVSAYLENLSRGFKWNCL